MMLRKSDEKGFSLVETILALGILGGVLVSIAGLFILGGKQVKSGREATEALSVARAVIEEMDGWSFHQTWQLYGIDGSTNTTATLDTRTNAYASKWQPTLDEALYNSHAEITISSLAPSGSPVPNLDSTRSIRIVVTVFWAEGQRNRSIQLGTVRM